jgi:hypothetical protein
MFKLSKTCDSSTICKTNIFINGIIISIDMMNLLIFDSLTTIFMSTFACNIFTITLSSIQTWEIV